MIDNKPLRITVEHWDDKITVEKPNSDITIYEMADVLRTLLLAMGYTNGLIDEILNAE